MKIGVLGGTFDPIHKGHLAIARAAMAEYRLDKMWFMPAGDPYFKEGSGVSSPEIRLGMTRACLDAFPDFFECSDFEISDREKTYSAITFDRLKRLYPEDRFYFVMGLDSLKSLHSWYRPELLLRSAVILCAARPEARDDDTGAASGISGELKALHEAAEDLRETFASEKPDIRIIHTPMRDISSTQIREMVSRGEDISALVTEEVRSYIEAHGLYRGQRPAKKMHYHAPIPEST